MSPKGGAKSVRRAKKSGNGRRLAPKTLRGRARARVFDGASAARSSSRFSAMRSLLCASRNNDLLRFEFLSSHLAGLRPAGSHCFRSFRGAIPQAEACHARTPANNHRCAQRTANSALHRRRKQIGRRFERPERVCKTAQSFVPAQRARVSSPATFRCA